MVNSPHSSNMTDKKKKELNQQIRSQKRESFGDYREGDVMKIMCDYFLVKKSHNNFFSKIFSLLILENLETGEIIKRSEFGPVTEAHLANPND